MNLRDVPVPTPGPGDLQVQMDGAGVRHVDLQLRDELSDGLLPVGPPSGLGHLTAQVLTAAPAVARQLADITVMGIGGGTVPFCFFGLPYEVSVQTTWWGNRAEPVEVLDLAARGLLDAEVTRFDLDHATEANDLLRRRELTGGAVVVAHEEYTS